MDEVQRVSQAICDTRTYETGQGGCAAICMQQRGDSRGGGGCQYCVTVHGRRAEAAIAAMIHMGYRKEVRSIMQGDRPN